MLSNAIWIMPTADRSAAPGQATVFYRCGSQAGKPAATVPDDLGEPDFTERTVAFIVAEIEIFRKAKSSRQKNSSRNLKKYFDAAQVAQVEHRAGELSDRELALELL
jgi:hypothetical protein